MKSLLFSTTFLILSYQISLSQNRTLDSLHNALKQLEDPNRKNQKTPQAKLDTTKANTLNEIAWESYQVNDSDQMKQYADEALRFSTSISYPKGRGIAFNTIGAYYRQNAVYDSARVAYLESISIGEAIQDDKIQAMAHTGMAVMYMNQAKYPESLKEAELAITFRKAIGDKKGLATAYTILGLIQKELGNYPEALVHHFQSLKLREEVLDSLGIASCYNNIGVIYNEQGETEEALKMHLACLAIVTAKGDKNGAANSHNNIGVIYGNEHKLDEALKEHQASLKLREETNDKIGIAYSLTNLGVNYSDRGMHEEALKEYFKALKIGEELEDPVTIVTAYLNIGTEYISLHRPKEGRLWFEKGLDLATEVGDQAGIQVSYQGLAQADSASGNFAGAYENHKLFVQWRDSILNEENTRKSVQSQMQYEFDKKEAASKAEQDKKDALTQAQLRRQRIIRNAFTGGFLLVAIFSTIVVRQRNKINTARKRSEELLLNILPGEVAEELKTKGTADAKHFDDVTVMFTDFKGFTQIAEKLTPAELVNEIHTCFKAFDEIITKYNVEKIKTIGDSYMCVGGLPVSNKTHATDAIRAAMEIQDFMQQHKFEREATGKPVFEIRIGIHTGPVVAGIVGVKKYSYDIWGDTVNTASRMESSGEAGKINISGETYKYLNGEFTCTHRGKIEARNKGGIDMYFVERRDSF